MKKPYSHQNLMTITATEELYNNSWDIMGESVYGQKI